MLKRIVISLIALIVFTLGTFLLFFNELYIAASLATLATTGIFATLILQYQENTKKLIFTLNALESDDFAFHFDDRFSKSKDTDKIFNYMLNRIKNMTERHKLELEERERYYETMLERADTGIIAVDNKSHVIYRNAKALSLIGLPILNNLVQIKNIDTKLYEAFRDADEGNDRKVSFSNEHGNITLSIACSRVTIKDKNVKILAVNNISDDIEANEVETWTRLIRVLTHEIMNSISPVASLSETLSKFYGNENAELKEGLDVINKTSRGLIDFVESYRSITRINKPMRKAIPFKQLITNILTLEKEEFSVNDISVEVTANRDDIMLYIDESQISQVIINVIKNAIQANANKLKISAFIDKDEVIRIEFANNGTPISKTMSEQIFVPFYTTKPSGNGIGLSISKKIMQNHDGAIQLLRSNEKETVFAIIFT